jgi:hypothetical protein
VALTYQTNTLRLFVDGTEVASGSNSGTTTVGNWKALIGNAEDGNEAFNGYIAAVRISDTALYTGAFTAPLPSEMALTEQLASLGDSYTIGLWQFGDVTGSTLFDSSSNQFDGTISGATTDSTCPE